MDQGSIYSSNLGLRHVNLCCFSLYYNSNLDLSEALASELAPEIRVNTVAPGFVPTHFADFLVRNEDIALASELAPEIRVNTVALGFVPTHFADFLVRNEDIKRGIEEKTLLGRLGKTIDTASAVAFLASSDASYITGETLVVAGGVPSRL